MYKMKKSEFDEIIYNEANDYAYSVIEDPEDHLDAVDEVIYDFIAGANYAWNLLRPNYNDEGTVC